MKGNKFSMKNINEYSNINDLTADFNEWFGIWLSSNEKSIDAITDEVIEVMLKITEWDEEVVRNTNKWNVVYWYCVQLLYLNNSNNDYTYLDVVYEFLDSITPFAS